MKNHPAFRAAFFVGAAAALGVAGLRPAVVAVGAQAGPTVWDGVYSAEQAQRGLGVYTQRCTACHADSLDGGGMAPGLAGDDFMADWQGKSVGDLFRRAMLTMPADDPGKLTAQETADVIAYVLSKNKFPAGANALSTDADALKLIRIESRKQ